MLFLQGDSEHDLIAGEQQNADK